MNTHKSGEAVRIVPAAPSRATGADGLMLADDGQGDAGMHAEENAAEPMLLEPATSPTITGSESGEQHHWLPEQYALLPNGGAGHPLVDRTSYRASPASWLPMQYVLLTCGSLKEVEDDDVSVIDAAMDSDDDDKEQAAVASVVHRAAQSCSNCHSAPCRCATLRVGPTTPSASRPPGVAANTPRKQRTQSTAFATPLRPAFARQVSVWNPSGVDSEEQRAKCVHGAVRELFPNGAARVVLTPESSRSPAESPHTGPRFVMSVPSECWAWGQHRTKPSLKAREVAACWATLGDDMRECGLAEAHSLPQPAADPCVEASFAPKLVRAVNPGERAWPFAFHDCMDALEVLHTKLARTGWLRNDGRIAAGTGHLLADLQTKGHTALADFAVRLLKYVPLKAWDGGSGWPALGDWSARLRQSHSPESLLLCIAFAMSKCIKWPDDSADINRPTQPRVLVSKASCFVCGFASSGQQSYSHPALRGARLCLTCHTRYATVEWTEDSELLDQICGACAHSHAAPHGCRTCGASLCERCMHVLLGPQWLSAARFHRFNPDLCAGCGQADEPVATYHAGLRVICDGCRLEWHPCCHFPPLTSLPGSSTRWLCADCVVAGEPQTIAWTMRSCSLCRAPAESAVRAAARSWMRQVRIVLGGVASRREGRPGASFDHAVALARLNENVAHCNVVLRHSPTTLHDAALAHVARHAAAGGGLCVVSYCDGKATLLGYLLQAGVHIRRYLSVECDANCNRVARTLYGSACEGLEPSALRFFGDARDLTVAKLKALDCHPVHLLVSSTPCQDLSRCKDVHKTAEASGLEGEHSRLFVDFASRLLPALRADNRGVPLAVFAENVIPAQRVHGS